MGGATAMKVRICDVETSGFPEEGGRICEIAWYDVDTSAAPYPIIGSRSYLVNPCMPMPPEVRAVHHIDPRDLIGRPVPNWAVAELLDGLEDGDVLCAHNAAFEQALINAPGVPWICTWKTGLRAWRDLGSHGNQALRYGLNIDDDPDFDPALAMPPHRALPDAYVTAHILRRLLALRPIERLVQISLEPAFLLKLNFGKHNGKTYEEAPLDYLEWIVKAPDMDVNRVATAQWHIDKRKRAAEAEKGTD